MRFVLLFFFVVPFSSDTNGGSKSWSKKKAPRFSFSNGDFRKRMPTRNISDLLDHLLLFNGYDRQLRPRFGGPPTVVEIDVEVRSMGQISELDMTFSMDCYFRQSWVDERLAFTDTEEAFTLSLSVLERLWKPDTYIHNGKHSYTHLITTPNRFIRLHNSGKILYSSRLTIQARCPMNLEDFPMDTQHCPLRLGSFGYTTADVVYRWNSKRQLAIAADMKLSQFDLIATPSGFENVTRRTGNFSVLTSFLHLRRNMGYFIIQVYAPCMLINVLSWVAFWINREATSDRVALGVTTVLTMTFLGLEARKDLPKVTYSTALDQFVWISFAFIFASVIEFAFVHSFTKFGSGEIMLAGLHNKWDESEEEEETKEEKRKAEDLDILEKVESGRPRCREVLILSANPYQNDKSNITYNRSLNHSSRHFYPKPDRDTIAHSSLPRDIEGKLNLGLTSSSLPHRLTKPKRPNHVTSFPIKEDVLFTSESPEIGPQFMNSKDIVRLNHSDVTRELCFVCKARRIGDADVIKRKKKRPQSLQGFLCRPWCRDRCNITRTRKRVMEARMEESKQRIPRSGQTNSVSSIDQVSRVLFPLSFFLINLLYWYSYLSHSQRFFF